MVGLAGIVISLGASGLTPSSLALRAWEWTAPAEPLPEAIPSLMRRALSPFNRSRLRAGVAEGLIVMPTIRVARR